jgi:hypothetical protein
MPETITPGLKTHTTNADLRRTVEKTHTTQTELRRTVEKTHTTQVDLNSGFSLVQSVQALLQQTQELQQTTDASIVLFQSRTFTTNALLLPYFSGNSAYSFPTFGLVGTGVATEPTVDNTKNIFYQNRQRLGATIGWGHTDLNIPWIWDHPAYLPPNPPVYGGLAVQVPTMEDPTRRERAQALALARQQRRETEQTQPSVAINARSSRRHRRH